VKRVAGRTDLEDGMKKLDKMTLEEVAMASAQLLKVTHDIHERSATVANGVDCVDQKVQVVVAQVGDIKCDVQAVGDQVEVVDERVQVIVDGEKCDFLSKTSL
jgi:methyl-accepting chemotaxis protein